MGKRVLVAEESQLIRKNLSNVLTKEGYEVVEAANGSSAYDRIKNDKIDVVICDIDIPDLDGMSFIRSIKSEEKYADSEFPIVIMLADESGEDKRNEGKEAGVRVWMTKPFSPSIILETLRNI